MSQAATQANPQATPLLSVVLPAYNAAAFISRSVEELLAYFDRSGIDGEVVVVDDGSADQTSRQVAVGPRVQALRLARNMGKGVAVRTGMLAARGRVRAFTDADLPYGVAPLDVALAYILKRGFHAVLGDRHLPGSTYRHIGPARRCLSALASFVFRTMITGAIYDTQCGFKALRGDVAAEVFSLARIDRFAFDVEVIYLLLKYNLDVKRIPIRLRANGTSTVRVFRESLRAVADIAQMRVNWARGRYRSDMLSRLTERELLQAESPVS